MTNSPVDDIKNKLDVVDLIQGYIRLQKAGRNYKAPCPFHSEKTPSFMVSPERQQWKCFGCGRGGSVFDFIMEMEGVEFGDALKILAQRAGVELKKVDPKLKTERTRIYEISQLANLFFVKQLEASKLGKEMQKYLIDRGLKKESIKDWQIGYAPNQWRSLKDFLNKQGYPNQELTKAGLVIEKNVTVSASPGNDRNFYDRFRDRIMFPIKDINGVVVGFTGRENPNNPDERMGKYINTPSTLIYDKSRILYGLDKAKLNIKKNDFCLMVEGQTDVIMSHQAGFSNAIATSGTALTPDQLKIIKRYTDNLTMAFDTDLAGETATKRGINLALQLDFNTKVINLPDNQDPAEYIKKDPNLFKKSIKDAQELIEFYLDTAFARNDHQTAKGKKEISASVLPMIKKIANKVEQAYWLQEAAKRLKVQETALTEEMDKIKETDIIRLSDSRMHSAIRKPNDSVDNLEEYALGLILTDNNSFKGCGKEPCYLFTNSDLEEIFKTLKKNKSKKINLKNLKKKLPDRLVNRVDEITFKMEAQNVLNEDTEEFEPGKEAKFCFSQLKKKYYQEKLNGLNLAIKEAESKKDKKTLKKLTNEFNNLSKEIINC